jgi:hypothetical protein
MSTQYKVGDKVRIIWGDSGYFDEIGIIEKQTDVTRYTVRFGDYLHEYDTLNFEPAASDDGDMTPADVAEAKQARTLDDVTGENERLKLDLMDALVSIAELQRQNVALTAHNRGLTVAMKTATEGLKCIQAGQTGDFTPAGAAANTLDDIVYALANTGNELVPTTDVEQLTARNRQLMEAGKKLLRAYEDQFGPANPEKYLPGTSKYRLNIERKGAEEVFNAKEGWQVDYDTLTARNRQLMEALKAIDDIIMSNLTGDTWDDKLVVLQLLGEEVAIRKITAPLLNSEK